jgi:outer membrane lipoprotein carrier protein
MYIKIITLLLIITQYSIASFKNINSLEADFIQKIIEPNGKSLIYKGKILIKKPTKIMWEYKEPVQKSVYIKGTYILIVEPQLEQIIFSGIDNGIDLLKIINGSDKIGKNKYVSYLFNKEFFVYKKNDKLDMIEYIDNFDNKVTIKLLNQKINQYIDTRRFNFTIPEDYDIIRR